MTVADVAPYGHYTGDGSLTTYSYAYYIASASELEVYVNNVLVSNYTVTGVGSASGGTFVFTSPPATAATIFHRRVTARTQGTDYVDHDPFSANGHESALDKLTRLVQDIVREELSRRPALATAVLSTLRNLTFPSPGALQVLGWNADGTALTLYNSSILAITVAATAGLAYAKTTVTVPAVDTAVQLTAASVFPAGSLALGATVRVTTGFGTSRGLTAFDVGLADALDCYGRGIALTLGTLTNVGQYLNYRIMPCPNATNVLLSAVAGQWDATGQCKITGHYLTLTPDS